MTNNEITEYLNEETHNNNTFTITDNLKSLVQEYKNECEYLKETNNV